VSARLIVQVRGGKLADKKAVVEPGRSLKVGRTDWADLAVPYDDKIRKIHFEIAWDGERCRVRRADGAGEMLLNGEPVTEGEVAHGDWIKAGQTVFGVFVEHRTPPPAVLPDDEDLDPREREARREARAREEARRRSAEGARSALAQAARSSGLYAVLDAARDRRVLELCRESVEEARSLYEGLKGETLSEVAPRLLRLPAESALLDRLVLEGWGKRWGIFVTCPLPFEEVRRHLRRFLMVEDEETGEPLYFRYYDPGVLRVFLPTCSRRQTEELLGPIEAVFVEAEDGGVVTFAPPARREA
jgi:hypothetical protein